jgi:hypothetical protein
MKSSRPSQFVRVSGPPQDVTGSLGPLASLAGTWIGSKGWSITALPGADSNPEGPAEFALLVQPYTEILEFAPLGGLVRNEGGDVDQFIAGLRYDQRVSHVESGEALHVENGMWLNLGDVTRQSGGAGPRPRYPIARTASVPHGNTAMLLGDALVHDGPPDIPDFSSLPPDMASAPKEYLAPYFAPHDGVNVVNPGVTLRGEIDGQAIESTTRIVVDSRNQGGIINVPFLIERADTTRFVTYLWIERVVDVGSGQTSEQLQYCQIIDLEFHPKFGDSDGRIVWPHITINTLRKQ